ncbi:MAG TPA: KH domain-containing protein [Chloroflexota bacterium]|nr:KH domain-containing protein [Chloroflexota bacterium]
MKPLVEFIARSLVDDPDAVEVRQREAGRTTIVELTVAPDDTGKVIGREGRVAKALRNILRVAGSRQRRRVILEID